MLHTSRSFIPSSGFSVDILKSSTLVLPSISIGNIPQLATDLLLHSLQFKKIGRLNDVYLYPFVSPTDYSIDNPCTGISTACEVYYDSNLNITIVQQRAPVIASFKTSHINEVILPFIGESKFNKIVILDSSDAGLLENVKTGFIEHYTNEDLLNKSLDSLRISSQGCSQEDYGLYNQSSYSNLLIGSLMGKCTQDIDISALVSYVYEGDNFNDGENLAHKLTQVLDSCEITRWVRPVSWLGVYGDKPIPSAMEDGLYG